MSIFDDQYRWFEIWVQKQFKKEFKEEFFNKNLDGSYSNDNINTMFYSFCAGW